jgi:hypothetical protein
MASGSIRTNTGLTLNLRIDWSSVSDSGTRTAQVTAIVYLEFTSLESGARSGNNLTINSSSFGYSTSAINDYTGSLHSIELYRNTITVGYGDNTNLSIPISATWIFNGTYSGTYIGTLNPSGTAVLDTIPPANTVPYWSAGAGITVGGSGASQIIAENVTSLAIAWSAANDAEGNTRYYTLRRNNYDAAGNFINTSVILTDTTGLSHTDTTIPTGNPGYRYVYTVQVRDASLTQSTLLQSATITKNALTGATATPGSSVAWNTSAVALTLSGASNTNGNSTFSYELGSNVAGLTMNNPTASPTNLRIFNDADAHPGITFLRLSEIKTALVGSNYAGSLSLKVKTTNAYGTAVWVNFNLNVDLRSNPSAVSITAGDFYTIGGTPRYIPNVRPIALSWTASTDNLGGAITYDVFSKLGTETEVQKATSQSGRTLSLTVNTPTSAVTLRIRVVAKTTYGTSTETTLDVTAHYYFPPTITFNPVSRTNTGAVVSGAVAFNTSIPGITISALSWVGKAGGSATPVTPAVVSFSIPETATLLETDTYSFTVNATDTTTGILPSSSGSGVVTVPRYIPKFSVRQKGVGVNALADDTYIFKVGGKIHSTEGFFKNGVEITPGSTETGATILSKLLTVDGTTSGLDADLLDGLHASTAKSANTIAARDASGYLHAVIFNSNYAQDNLAASSYWYEYNNDGYHRRKSLANVRAEILSGHTHADKMSFSQIGGVDLNGLATPSIYSAQDNCSNKPENAWGSVIMSYISHSLWCQQLWLGQNGGLFYRRSYDSAGARAWDGWREIFTTGNCTVTGDDNNRSWRYPNGMQIVQQRFVVTTTVNTAWGSLWESPDQTPPNFVQAFSQSPACTLSVEAYTGGYAMLEMGGGCTVSRAQTFNLVRGTASGSASWIVHVHAVGRWN